MAWRRLILPGSLALFCACTLISGAADLEIARDAEPPRSEAASTEGGTDDDAGVDAGPTCVAPARCLTAPVGWEGPFAIVLNEGSGELGNACPAGFVRSWERVGATDAAVPPAQCTCACGALGGTCAVAVREYDQERCTGSLGLRTLKPSACAQPAGGADSWTAIVTPQPTCPVDASTTLPSLDASASAVGCTPREPAGCEVGACVPPAPPAGRLCVRSTKIDGGPCPSGWPDQALIAQGLEDTRGCSSCKCAAAAPICSFTYTLYDSNDCTGGGAATSNTSCRSAGGVDSLKLNAVSVSGSCTPTGGQATGGVTTSPAVVLCCLAP